MADFNLPILTSLYTDMVNFLKDRDVNIMKWLDGTTDTNIPSGAKRWNSTNNYFEKYNGTTWSALTTKYMIDVDKVDGCTVNDAGTSTTDLWTASKINTQKLDASAYTAADVLTKIKTVDGSASGLDADLLDGQDGTYYTNATNLGSGTVPNARITGDYSGFTSVTGSASSTFVNHLGSSLGSVTVPTFSWTGDPNTGIYSPAADQLAITTGGVQRALFSSTGISGVGSGLTSLTGNNIVWGTANTAGKFYTGTTTPTGTTRLNYSGYLYPTFLNLTGSSDTTAAATHYFVETGSDGFVRPKTLANVQSEIVTKAVVEASGARLGATGGGTDSIFYENGQTVTTNYTIPTGKNAMSAGDITINTGVVVTISDGSRWVVI